MAGCGTNAAALAFAGGPPNVASTETYDGTSWTSGNDLNTARESPGGGGTNTAALCFGGYSTISDTVTEEFDGTSWTEVADLATGRYALSGCGETQAAVLATGGSPTIASTEIWTKSLTAKTVTVS